MMETTKSANIFYFKAGAMNELQDWSYNIKHKIDSHSFNNDIEPSFKKEEEEVLFW